MDASGYDISMRSNSKEGVMALSSVPKPYQCECSYHNYFFKVDTFFPLPVHLAGPSTVIQSPASAPIVDFCS